MAAWGIGSGGGGGGATAGGIPARGGGGGGTAGAGGGGGGGCCSTRGGGGGVRTRLREFLLGAAGGGAWAATAAPMRGGGGGAGTGRVPKDERGGGGGGARGLGSPARVGSDWWWDRLWKSNECLETAAAGRGCCSLVSSRTSAWRAGPWATSRSEGSPLMVKACSSSAPLGSTGAMAGTGSTVLGGCGGGGGAAAKAFMGGFGPGLAPSSEKKAPIDAEELRNVPVDAGARLKFIGRWSGPSGRFPAEEFRARRVRAADLRTMQGEQPGSLDDVPGPSDT